MSLTIHARGEASERDKPQPSQDETHITTAAEVENNREACAHAVQQRLPLIHPPHKHCRTRQPSSLQQQPILNIQRLLLLFLVPPPRVHLQNSQMLKEPSKTRRSAAISCQAYAQITFRCKLKSPFSSGDLSNKKREEQDTSQTQGKRVPGLQNTIPCARVVVKNAPITRMWMPCTPYPKEHAHEILRTQTNHGKTLRL